MKLVSVVIPAYNEEESIGNSIQEVKKAIKYISNYDFEIIVINNNSKDKTEEIAKKNGAKVVFEDKKGYGHAYKKGLSEVKGDIIITGDGDATYPFYDIPRFLKLMEESDFDFISTNRFAHLEEGSMPLLNHVGNFSLTFFSNLLYGTKISDSQSGMVIFNRNYLDKVNLSILSNGMPLCQELKLYAISLRVKFTEVPIKYRKRLGDAKLKPVKDGVENLIELFKFKRKVRSEILKWPINRSI